MVARSNNKSVLYLFTLLQYIAHFDIHSGIYWADLLTGYSFI